MSPISVFNQQSAVTRRKRKRTSSKVRSTTVREFGGGWNEVDAPSGLSLKYAKVLRNWYRKQDGSQAIRYGCEWKYDISLTNLADEYLGTFYEAQTGREDGGDAITNGANLGFRIRTPDIEETTISRASLKNAYVATSSDWVAKVYTDNSGSPGTQVGTDSATVTIDAYYVAWANSTAYVLGDRIVDTSTEVVYVCQVGHTSAAASTTFADDRAANPTYWAADPGEDEIFTFSTPIPVDADTNYWIVFEDQGAGDITFFVVANQGGNIASGKHDTVASIADDQLGSSYDFQGRVNLDRTISGDIVDLKYFNGSIINVTTDGEIARATDTFTVSCIWSEALAREQNGNPTGWSTSLDFVSFTEIKGSMVICNGEDKPLEVQSNFSTRYLQDLATGSNVNTPIGKYCTTVADYLCIAGVAAEPTVVYIGSKGTIGTFVGDDPPNDSVALDVGAFAPEDGQEIRGTSSFRNFLFVHFLSATLKIVLGEYDDSGNHVPRVDDTLQKFGILSHRCAIPVANDLLFDDITGANTIRRNVLSDAVEPSRLSDLIAPAYQNQVTGLTQTELLTDVFAVYDRLAGHYMIFVPTGVDNNVRAFVFTFNEKMGRKAWSEFVGWSWRAATSSALGRVFFAKDTRVYQYGNQAYEEEFSADFLGEYDYVWDNSTAYAQNDRVKDSVSGDVYVAQSAHTSASSGTFEDARTASPTLWMEYDGEAINFDWELPWTDANSRARIKRLSNLFFDSQGTSQFYIQAFADNIYLDADGLYDPGLELQYTAGDSPGYGGGDQPYGGGRRTTDERMWSHPLKFRLLKLRFYGSTKLPLRIVSITLLFAEGRYGR